MRDVMFPPFFSQGVFPAEGFYKEELDGDRRKLIGSSIAGGFCGAFIGVKADGKARAEIHRHKRHPGATFICDRCLACRLFKNAPSQLYYGDFSELAAHLETWIDNDTYIKTEKCVSPWMSIPGARSELFFMDWFHSAWLGTARDLAGAVLSDMCERSPLTSTGARWRNRHAACPSP